MRLRFGGSLTDDQFFLRRDDVHAAITCHRKVQTAHCVAPNREYESARTPTHLNRDTVSFLRFHGVLNYVVRNLLLRGSVSEIAPFTAAFVRQ